MSDEQAKKEEWLQILNNVPSAAARIEAMGQHMIQAARLSQDIAGPVRDIITNLPSGALPAAELNRGLESWKEWKRMADQVQNAEPLASGFVASVYATTNTVASGVGGCFPIVAPTSQPVQAARTRLSQVLARRPLVDQARSLMMRLGLHSRGGAARSALDLLDEALGALERPVVNEGGPTSVLVSLRESIDAAITELIRRRPIQEKVSVSGWRGKVLSLGHHCGRSSLSATQFDRLGSEAETLMGNLSRFKQRAAPRTQLSELFSGGIAFLNALLSSIDESKLRPAGNTP
jgi:hypothetical protein